MKVNSSIIRQLLHRSFSTLRSRNPSPCSSSLPNCVRSILLVPNSISTQFARNSLFAVSSIWVSDEFNASNTYLPGGRSFCSASGDQSKVVVLKSEEELKNALHKAQDGLLPSVFYFTAAWCGPCRFISPVIMELSEKYSNVTTYKVDIDEDGLSSTISKLNISAVPTLHFFKEGAKKAEIVGADVAKLKNLMEQLYK